jgi:hypothetical protein
MLINRETFLVMIANGHRVPLDHLTDEAIQCVETMKQKGKVILVGDLALASSSFIKTYKQLRGD